MSNAARRLVCAGHEIYASYPSHKRSGGALALFAVLPHFRAFCVPRGTARSGARSRPRRVATGAGFHPNRSLTIEWCGKLRALPRGLGKLGALKQLTLRGLDELQEMPDLIGLTAA